MNAPLPRTVFLELTNACDLRCPICPTTYHRGPRHLLDATLARRLLAEVAPAGPNLFLYGWGEPLLHPEAIDLTRDAVALGLKVRLSSHLNRVSEPDLRSLATSGLHRLRVSMDAATPATYARARPGGDFQQVVANIKTLLAFRGATRRPRIELAFVVSRLNQHEIGAFRDLAAGLGVDRVRFKTLLALDDGHADALLPDDPSLHSYQARSATPRAHGRCAMPGEGLAVGADGRAYFCTLARARATAGLGDLHQAPLATVWNGAAARDLRSRLAADPCAAAPCRSCPQAVRPIAAAGWDRVLPVTA